MDLALYVKSLSGGRVSASQRGPAQQSMNRHGTVEVPQSLEPMESQSQEEIAGRVYASSNQKGLTQRSMTHHEERSQKLDLALESQREENG